MIYVATVRASNGGFEMYEAGPEWSREEIADVGEYIAACRANGAAAYSDGEDGITADAQAAIDAVNGRVYNQRGTLVATRWDERDGWSVSCVDHTS